MGCFETEVGLESADYFDGVVFLLFLLMLLLELMELITGELLIISQHQRKLFSF